MFQRSIALLVIAALTMACDTRVGGVVGVTPPATRIGFLIQPATTQAGVTMTPVQVAIQNTSGQPVPSTNAPITLSLVPGTGTAGAVLTGSATQPAVNGVVSFSGLRIDLAGTGYQLQATAAGFPTIASLPFNITP